MAQALVRRLGEISPAPSPGLAFLGQLYESTVSALKQFGKDSLRFEDALQEFSQAIGPQYYVSMGRGIFSEVHFKELVLPALQSKRYNIARKGLSMSWEYDRSRPLPAPLTTAVVRQYGQILVSEMFDADGILDMVLPPLVVHLVPGPGRSNTDDAHLLWLANLAIEAGLVETLGRYLSRTPAPDAPPAARKALPEAQHDCCKHLSRVLSALFRLGLEGPAQRMQSQQAVCCLVDCVPRIASVALSLVEERELGNPGLGEDFHALSLLVNMALHVSLGEQFRAAAGTRAGSAAAAAAAPRRNSGNGGVSSSSGSSSSRRQEAASGGQEEPARCARCGVQKGSAGTAGAAAGGAAKLRRCGGCRAVWYCGTECQKGHWPEHKAACKAAAGKEGMG